MCCGYGNLFSEDGRQLENLNGQVWLMAAFASANDAIAVELAQSMFVGRGTPPHSLIIALRQARPWLGNLKANASIGQLLRRVDKFEERLPALRRGLRRLPQTVSLSAPRLVIHGLGWTKVIVNGEVAEWPTQSVRELFFFFLTAPNAMMLNPEKSNHAGRLRVIFIHARYRMACLSVLD